MVGDVRKSSSAILVVDDEEPIPRMLACLLERHGHRCTLAANAHDARRRLDETEYALIFCDVNMPGGSGLDLVRHVLQAHPQTAAVMVTGLDDPRLAKGAALVAWMHHEKFDGSGYPRGSAGDAISAEGRILAIADAFDARTGPPPYRPASPINLDLGGAFHG